MGSNQEKIKEITARLEAGIQELFQTEKFSDYLRTMSRFHSYSYSNTILIHMQMPSATHVAGFNKWKNQFGRHVKKGERGLTIIAPTPFKKRVEEMKLDPDTRAPVLDHDGNIVMEEREIEIPLFRPVKVFDVSQTAGRPLPSLVSPLTGDVQQYEAFMEALGRTSPVPVQFKTLPEGLDGVFSRKNQTITIQEGMSQVQTVCAAVHEITHAMLHNREKERLSAVAGTEQAEEVKLKDRSTEEVEAESVSYTVCQYYGIETSANSLGYIATWSKDKTLPELKASLETISKTANILITSIDRHFQEICKERGIALTAQQPEQNAHAAAPDTLEQFAADLYDFMEQLHQEGVLKHPFTQDPRERSIADLVDEMRKGYFEGVRDPLNYLIEHTSLLLSDLTKVKTLLARLDGLIQVQDAPAAKLPPDTPERFISDLLDLLDRLYQAGTIKKNFSPDNRDQTKANLVRALRVNPSIVRATLEQFVQQDTGAAEATVMLERLDGLTQEQAPEYEYTVGDEGGRGQFLLMAYRKMDGGAKLNRTMFVGDEATCNTLLEKLQAGTLHFEDFCFMRAARVSRYVTKDGAELDALVGENDKIYLGRRDHYDSCGHYVNDDHSLLYLSDNDKVFHFISGEGYSISQADMAAQGYLTQEDYAEFDALRVGVLAQFEQTEPFLFAGEPFSFIQPDAAEQEQAAVTEVRNKQESRLDEYPLPAPAFPADGLEQDYGYAGGDLLPLPRERAAELLEQDLTVYMVKAGENPAMVFDRDDLMEQPEGMMFAVSRREWEDSLDFRQAVADRMNRQEDRERAFLDHGGDCFAIYQVSREDPHNTRFMSMDWLNSHGISPERGSYDLVYTAPLPAAPSVGAALEALFERFNVDHPADYRHPSMSVSDIVAIKRGGVVSCHYCDSVGFCQLTDFLPAASAAALEGKEKRKSVMAQLKSQLTPERKKTEPKKSAEQER